MNRYKINGITVLVEDGAEKGYQHLKHDLQSSESEVFFHEARRVGKADFEDDNERNFILVYNRDGTYTIRRRN